MNGKLVYSSRQGRICPECERPVPDCECQAESTAATSDGIVRVGRETKGRKGKGVTTVSGIALPSAELKKLGKRLKQRCGTGGTVRDGVIELQGEHRDTVIGELTKLGMTVKR